MNNNIESIKELEALLEKMTPRKRAQYIKVISECKELSAISFSLIRFIRTYYEVDERNIQC